MVGNRTYYPLLSLLLEGRGVSPLVIGLNASMLPLGLVLSAPFIPSLATRFRPWRFAGSALLAGTAALTAMFGLGGIAGPSLGGGAMEQFGPEGLPALVTVAYGLLLAVSLVRGRR